MQKGVALYLSVIVMALLLIIVFGLSAIVRNQIKMVRDAEESVLALYAADAGIEKFLVVVVHNLAVPGATYAASLDNGASYIANVKCCQYTVPAAPGCNASAAICGTLPQDLSCAAKFYCAKSVGTYRGTTRGIFVNI